MALRQTGLTIQQMYVYPYLYVTAILLIDSAWQKIHGFYGRILENGDKRTDPWLLVYSPIPVTAIFLCYLFLVWAGPKLMNHREPMDLRVALIIYDFTMVGWSAYMVYEFLVSSWLANYSLLCQPVDYSSNLLAIRMAKVFWWYFFCKVFELGDTVFFILRKKNSQVTFLHVYHHGTVIFTWWAGVKYLAGGQWLLSALLNSSVHVVMYLYYGLAALGPHMQKYLWWKRYLTSLQLGQLVLLVVHVTYNLFADCDFPDAMNAMSIAYLLSLIVLFVNFYNQSYIKQKAKQKT